jgi:hypothetical protein
MVNNIAGGVDNAGELILEQSVVTDSTAVSSFPNPFGTAGGILNSGTLALIHSLVEDNSASGGCVTAGGIVNIVNGKLLTEESVVRDNAATGSSSGSCGGPSSVPAAGGIVNNQSLLVASTTTIDENAITNNGTMLLDRSTVSNTTISDLDVLYAVNSTLYQAPISIEYLPSFFVGVVHINSSTVYSTAMPGVNLPPLPTSTISDSILAGYPGGDCTGDFTSGGYNLIEHSVGCTVLVPDHDLLNIAAGLGSFGGHGGPTRTINLVPGSPALGGGNPAGCKGPGGIILTEDQRGDPRPAPGVGVCDIGSVQD